MKRYTRGINPLEVYFRYQVIKKIYGNFSECVSVCVSMFFSFFFWLYTAIKISRNLNVRCFVIYALNKQIIKKKSDFESSEGGLVVYGGV